MQAVIMAGGMGVRLRPFTYVIPKPLLPLGDGTILENIVRDLSKAGFTEIFILTSYQHEKFSDCYEYGEKYGVKIIIQEEKQKMGTAGGLTLIKDKLSENFLLLNADLLVMTNFLEMVEYHIENRVEITIGVTKFEYIIPYSIVQFNEENELTKITEKPTKNFIVNSGIYVLNKKVLEVMGATDYLDMPSLISEAMEKNMVIKTYDIGHCWLDMGHLDDYERAAEKIEKWSKDYPNCAYR